MYIQNKKNSEIILKKNCMQKKLDLQGAALEASAAAPAGAPRLAPPPGSTASGRAPRRRAFPSPARRTAAFPPAAATPPLPAASPAAGPSRRLRLAAGQLPRLGAEE